MLARSPSAQIPIGQQVEFEKSIFKDRRIRLMEIDYATIADQMQETREILKSIFVR